MRAIYSIEGNIGSGKSTFLNLLQKRLPAIEVVPEPVAEWQMISSEFNLLDHYYKNPSRWAFTFQINAILSRMRQLHQLIHASDTLPSQKVLFTERSIMADRQIFAKLLFNQNKLNQMEYQIYLNMYDSMESLFKTPRVHKIIYLRNSPEKCLQRMKKRGRFQQNSIPLQYLQTIHELHEQWLLGNSASVLVVDGEKQFETDIQAEEELMGAVARFTQIGSDHQNCRKEETIG